ncbi:MAG TPA: hypothetical protein VFT65_19160 [Candidatus Angelobacter sp.]|nr:hypothetical protein [Candidatus Angelobacter sp.]
MNNRIVSALLFFSFWMWTILGLLFLLRLHYWITGSVCLALAALSLFNALRFRKRLAAEKLAAERPASGASTAEPGNPSAS